MHIISTNTIIANSLLTHSLTHFICTYISFQNQLNCVIGLSREIAPLQKKLQAIETLDQACLEANIEENDYTVYSLEDLTFELGLVERAIRKKIAFIENQVIIYIS